MYVLHDFSEWDASEEPSECSIELKVSKPNWLCAEREEVLKKVYVPLTQLDAEGIHICMVIKILSPSILKGIFLFGNHHRHKLTYEAFHLIVLVA